MALKRTLKVFAVAAAAALSLSGCIRIEATMNFADGSVTPSMMVKINEKFLQENEADLDATLEGLKEISPEDGQKICENFIGETDLKETKVEAKGVQDGWLTCDISAEAIPVKELNSSGNKAFGELAYDEKEKVYTIKWDPKNGTTGENSEFTPSQAKALGMKFNIVYKFQGEVREVKVGETKVTEEKPLNGVTVTGNTVTVDIISDNKDVVTIVGSDNESGSNLLVTGVVILLALGLLGGIALLIFNSRKKQTPPPANNFPQGPPVAPTMSPVSNPYPQGTPNPYIGNLPPQNMNEGSSWGVLPKNPS